MSEAYASTLEISFDVRGGLLIRQIHHWAALIFVAAMVVHMARVFFTGAFRKPREANWIIGVILLTLSFIEGLAGYSLPDDLLSGTGLRITQGVLLSLPVVGTYVSFFLFGGEFPGEDIIPRLYTVHVLLIPGIFLALITVHLMLVWYQKHTQYPLPGRTEKNAVGYPFFPVYMAKAGGFFFITFGVTTLLSAFATINPIWLFGPYNPGKISAGSQPDWYMGFLEGALRLFPNWETQLFGYTIPWNVLGPGADHPRPDVHAAGALPVHRTLGHRRQRGAPRPRPAAQRPDPHRSRCAGDLDLADPAGASAPTTSSRTRSTCRSTPSPGRSGSAIFVIPPLAYVVTKRICLGLQRRDRELVLHGRETGRIVRLPHGEMIEVHEPISDAKQVGAHPAPRPGAARDRPDDGRQRRTAPAAARVEDPGPGVALLLRGPGRAADARRGARAGVQRSPLTRGSSASSPAPPGTSAAGWCPSCSPRVTGSGSWRGTRRACGTIPGPATSRSCRPTRRTPGRCARRWPASTSRTT